MGVDDDVLVLAGDVHDLLEHRPAERIEPGDRQIENPPGRHVGGFLVHHFADVADLQVQAVLVSDLLDGFEIGAFVYADLAGDECAAVLHE